MNERLRVSLFAISGLGMAAIFVATLGLLPPFGHYPGPYGDIINACAFYERHITNAVTAVNFDYRALDTLGEEFILFAAVSSAVMLQRGPRGASLDAGAFRLAGRQQLPRNDMVRWISLSIFGATAVFGGYIIFHGNLSPGGGFQGGAVLSSALLLLYLGQDYRTYCRCTPRRWFDIAESIGAAAFVIFGLFGLLSGGAFLQNVLPLGTPGDLLSGGLIPFINSGVGLEVACGLTLVLREFLEETRVPEPAGEEH